MANFQSDEYLWSGNLNHTKFKTKNTFSTPGELLETFSFKILFDMIFQLLLGQSGTFGFTMTNFVLGQQLVKVKILKWK